ncbi:MAG: hypothetical protein MZV63_60295 [Marinilabiliales bacterium]|nr:hypothetical protein [Marinilabiliales bacterium]
MDTSGCFNSRLHTVIVNPLADADFTWERYQLSGLTGSVHRPLLDANRLIVVHRSVDMGLWRRLHRHRRSCSLDHRISVTLSHREHRLML